MTAIAPPHVAISTAWTLVYTKPRAEAWAEANLRNQGFLTLLPRVRTRAGIGPLFPRYLFVGFLPAQRLAPLRSTSGVAHVVHFDDHEVVVPLPVIAEIRERMDAHGMVTVDPAAMHSPLFDPQQRARIRALVKLAAAGYRVKSA